MSVAIWLGNEVGLMKQANYMEGVYGIVVEDNFDRLYTKYGFVYSLKAFEVDYVAMMEGRLPKAPKTVQDDSNVIHWMLIDHYGSVYQVDYWTVIEDGYKVKKMATYSLPGGKVAKMIVGGDESDSELLAGFIKVCADKEKITQYVAEGYVERGYKIHWFNKDDIVAKLHELYPLNSNLG